MGVTLEIIANLKLAKICTYKNYLNSNLFYLLLTQKTNLLKILCVLLKFTPVKINSFKVINDMNMVPVQMLITVFAQMDAAATIIFRSGKMRHLFEGGYCSRAATI